MDKIVTLADLKPDPKNARRHAPRNIAQVVASLQQVGAARSGVIDEDGLILAGNGTWSALAEAGIERVKVVEADGNEWVVVQRKGLSEQQKRILSVSDNSSGALATWDGPTLEAQGIDLKPWFTPEELQAITAANGNGHVELEDVEPQIDKAEELRQKWQVETGQLWQLGEHRLLCGDSTKREDVERVMGGEKAELVFTDPPYNIASENDVVAANVSKSMSNLKESAWDHDFNLMPALSCLFSVLAPDVTVYVCTSHHLAPVIWQWMKEWSAHHEWCAWEKPNPMPSLMKRHWTWNAELVAYATRGKHTFNFPFEGHAPSIWRFNKHKETGHPTEKPIEVAEHAIAHSSNTGQLVLDGFLGSGTTLIACEKLNRKCRAIEIAPQYVGVTLQRFFDATGKEPRLS